jgi:hypothetical protein
MPETGMTSFGLVSAPPHRPGDDVSGLEAAGELDGDMADFLGRPADQARGLGGRGGGVFGRRGISAWGRSSWSGRAGPRQLRNNSARTLSAIAMVSVAVIRTSRSPDLARQAIAATSDSIHSRSYSSRAAKCLGPNGDITPIIGSYLSCQWQ